MLRNFIAGRFQSAVSPGRTDIVDPATAGCIETAPVSGHDEVDLAFAAAVSAAPDWAGRTPAYRAAALLRLAGLLEQHGERVADAECSNTGKPRSWWIPAELAHSVDVLRFAAGATRALPGTTAAEYLPGMTSWLRRQPVGVVAAIVPWNFPLMMAMWKLAPILAVGNTCVLKPAELTPITALLVAELALEAGVAPGVLNVVCGDASTGRMMVSDPRADMVAFTGSVAAGREVAVTAALTLKRTHLELGGKAAAVVLNDLAANPTDLLEYLERIVGAAVFNAGQSCTAVTRVIATDRVFEQVVSGIIGTASRINTQRDGTFGPLISAAHRQQVHDIVCRRGSHTELLVGGAPCVGDGFFYPVTVIAGAREDDELVQREVFGPVITIQHATDETDAVRMANATPFGLAASVWTADHAAAMRVASRLIAGDIWVNDHGMQASEMPHGGCRQSGYGSDLAVESLLGYTRPVHVASRWR